MWTVEHRAARIQNVAFFVKMTERGGRENNDTDNDHEDAEDQGADTRAPGSGGVGLGQHLPVPGLHRVGGGSRS